MKNKHIQGFTLIEVAIVLAVMGVIIGIGMPILNKYNTHSKISVTKTRMEQITQSLAGYVLANGDLPRPSTDSDSGTQSFNSRIGYIPFKTLGIAESMSKDGFGKRFRYMVKGSSNDDLRGNTSGNFQDNYCNIPPGGQQFRILNAQRQTVNSEQGHDFVVFILLSDNSGDDKAVDELANLDESPNYIQKPYVESGDNRFRQVIKWETRNNLVAIYGRYPCATVQHQAPIQHGSGLDFPQTELPDDIDRGIRDDP